MKDEPRQRCRGGRNGEGKRGGKQGIRIIDTISYQGTKFPS